MSGLKPANVEAALVARLKTPLQSAPAATVGTKIPNPRPPYLVRVGRVGGDQINLVQERVVALFECWAPDDLTAWELAARVFGLVEGREGFVAGGVELSDPSLSTPVNYPDPVSNLPRYQFTGTFTAALKETTS